MSLRSEAQKILADLSQDQRKYDENLKSILSSIFCPKELVVAQSRIQIPSTPKNQLLLRVEFRSRPRQQGESPSDYGFTLRKLEILAFPEMAYLDRKIYELNKQF